MAQRKTMARYDDSPAETHRLMRQAASDIAQDKQDTECRGETPASAECPSPAKPKKPAARKQR